MAQRMEGPEVSKTIDTTNAEDGDPWAPDSPDLSKMPDLPERLRGFKFTAGPVDLESLDVDKQLKVARFRDFEIVCDEPGYLGGDDEHPQPLTYVAAGVGFCLMTQVQRVARMKKKRVTRVECRCEFDALQDGSVLRGDYRAEVTEFRVHLEIESPESEEDIADVLRLAKRSCFAEALVRTAIPMASTFRVNGEMVEVNHVD